MCDYVNKAAFCYIAVSGNSFLYSAWMALLLHIKHVMKFAFAKLIAKMFILIGKVAIVAMNVFSLM